MKTMGLIGGMSWESSLEYYKLINELIKYELGNLHSCRSIMYSVDFGEIEKLQHENKWEELTNIMINACLNLEKAGADFIVICTNTMHQMVRAMEQKTRLPILHIADATALEIKSQDLKKVALIGTKFTMEKDFYKRRINEKFGIDVIIPEDKEREIIHKIIYEELVQGIISEISKQKYVEVIDSLKRRGAEGVILGCTEIPLLIKQKDCSIPLFDTTTIHAKAAVKYALEN